MPPTRKITVRFETPAIEKSFDSTVGVDITKHVRGKFLHGLTITRPPSGISKVHIEVGGTNMFTFTDEDFDALPLTANLLAPYMLGTNIDISAAYHDVRVRFEATVSEQLILTETRYRPTDDAVLVWDDEEGAAVKRNKVEAYVREERVYTYKIPEFSCDVCLEVSENPDDRDGRKRSESHILQKFEHVGHQDFRVKLSLKLLYGLWSSRSASPIDEITPELQKAIDSRKPYVVACKNTIRKIDGLLVLAFSH